MSQDLSTAIAQEPVRDFRTGMELDVPNADTETLATYLVDAAELHRQIGFAESAVNDELVRRMDRDLTWTATVGSGAEGYQFELSTSSPNAGSEDYPADALAQELEGLVGAEIISAAGAEKALRRRLKIVVDVPWSASLRAMVEQLKRSTAITIAGVECQLTDTKREEKPQRSGIAALAKIPGAGQALARVRTTKEPGRRKVRVELKGQR